MARLIVCTLAAAMLPSFGGVAHGVTPSCPSVFLPEGYDSTCSIERDETWRLEVTAEDAPIGELARLTVRPVDEETVEDPFSWLQEQLVVDLTGFRDLIADLLEHPENPLSEFLAPGVFDTWLEQFGLLGHLPLRGCAYPFELADKDVWQMDCQWTIGPVQQLVRLQLVDAANDPYLITIWTVDERRQRHLQAIANSLEWRV